MWPDRRLVDLLGVRHPIVLAPMAGAMDSELVIAVCEAGGLGSLPTATSDEARVRAELATIRRATKAPVNLNFFCHRPPMFDPARDARWREKLAAYHAELGVPVGGSGAGRTPFDERLCELVEEQRPEVVSFHFGLPAPALLERVKRAGCEVLASATTVAEARWLEERGVDAIVAQGFEAGGHRGMFLTEDVATQVGTFALVPQVVDAVRVPVIAAGGIADARGIAAAFVLGAAGVQIGTAYLRCPESKISPPFRAALASAAEDATVITNVITGRPARGILNRVIRELGPMNDDAPPFPLAAAAIAPLRASAEAAGSVDFSPMWSGQAAALAAPLPAGELTARLANEAVALLRRLGTAAQPEAGRSVIGASSGADP